MFNFEWITILIPKSWRAAVYEAIAFVSLSTVLTRLQSIFFDSKPGLSLLVIIICLPIAIYCVVQFLRLQTIRTGYNSLEVLNELYKDEKNRQVSMKPWTMDPPESVDSQNKESENN